MKAATVLQSELIGLKAKVVKSTNHDAIGISGKIVDETRNTLVIRHGDDYKTVAKDTAVFQLTLRDGSLVEVEGNALMGSPENRVKKKLRRRW
jgi:ribonuclease P protein subunit POP4